MALHNKFPRRELFEEAPEEVGGPFDTRESIEEASDEELLAIKGVGPKLLEQVREFDWTQPEEEEQDEEEQVSEESEDDLPPGVSRASHGTLTATSQIGIEPTTQLDK